MENAKVLNLQMEELEQIVAPGWLEEFVIGFATGLGVVAAVVALT